MRILISNDDGIHAPGLALLERAARQLSEDVWVVAPDGNRSGYGHGISLRRSMEIRQIAPQHYACSGTPADCVIAALGWLFQGGKQPDLVLSGINEGRNVAEDIAYSGTMAVAREATMSGIPAVAFSRPRYREGHAPGDAQWLAHHLQQFWATHQTWAAQGHWLSINLPRTLPATLQAAHIRSDKIAQGVIVHAEQGREYAQLEPQATRSYSATAGDENALLAVGIASVARLNWRGCSPVPAAVTSPG